MRLMPCGISSRPAALVQGSSSSQSTACRTRRAAPIGLRRFEIHGKCNFSNTPADGRICQVLCQPTPCPAAISDESTAHFDLNQRKATGHEISRGSNEVRPVGIEPTTCGLEVSIDYDTPLRPTTEAPGNRGFLMRRCSPASSNVAGVWSVYGVLGVSIGDLWRHRLLGLVPFGEVQPEVRGDLLGTP